MIPVLKTHVSEFKEKLSALEHQLDGLAAVNDMAGAELLVRLDRAARTVELGRKKVQKTATSKP